MTRREWIAAGLAGMGALRAWPAGVWAQGPRPADLTAIGAADLVARIRRGEFSALEAVEAYLSRIAAMDADLRAYVTTTAADARDRARELAAEHAATGRGGLPLHGLPIAHKDLFETAGVRTTGGSRLYQAHVPSRDATLVARLAAAGAVTLGKTNTHELGGGVTTINPFYGTTRNPRDRERIAGGSSGGSAAAVAAHLAAAATGTDTGGSIRIPAAFCGCVGFKPTHGLLSTAGVLGASPTFDHAGFVARSVQDVVLLMRVSVGVDPADPSTVPPPADLLGEVPPAALRGLRVGLPRAYFFEDLDAEVGQAVEKALGAMRGAGARLVDVVLPVDGGTMARVFDPIVVSEIRATYDRAWRDTPDAFSKDFASFFDVPLPSGLELAEAYRARRQFQALMAGVFDQVDVLAMPTVPVVAPRIAGRIEGSLILRNTWPFNAAHAPALTLPCGPPDGLPVGLQLIGRPFGDARLLAAGMAVSAIL